MDISKTHCKVCEIGMPPMHDREEDRHMKEVPSWTLNREGVHKIIKQFVFKDFREAIKFVNKVANLAEEEGHHPDIHIFYNKVSIELSTHNIRGLSENDFILASKIEMIK